MLGDEHCCHCENGLKISKDVKSFVLPLGMIMVTGSDAALLLRCFQGTSELRNCNHCRPITQQELHMWPGKHLPLPLDAAITQVRLIEKVRAITRGLIISLWNPVRFFPSLLIPLWGIRNWFSVTFTIVVSPLRRGIEMSFKATVGVPDHPSFSFS